MAVDAGVCDASSVGEDVGTAGECSVGLVVGSFISITTAESVACKSGDGVVVGDDVGTGVVVTWISITTQFRDASNTSNELAATTLWLTIKRLANNVFIVQCLFTGTQRAPSRRCIHPSSR